eukprot:TRINITY_DN37439_c0_g1_i1.p1 TRINITY_DN37439_c0_g1~~TRINITY_DN37439_c0_g1_i1.p1  ORF type:complete len:337 (+),score=66.36 TRINITY_DN37439_c0_g1_i1:77-1087(+)
MEVLEVQELPKFPQAACEDSQIGLVAMSAPAKTFNFDIFSSVFMDVMANLCSVLTLDALGALGTTSRMGCVATESTTVAAWRKLLETHAGIRLAPGSEPSCVVPVRDELRFWLPMVKRLRLDLPAERFASFRWHFRNVEELQSARGMAEDAATLLEEEDRRPFSEMPNCRTRRLTFRFHQKDLDEMRQAATSLDTVPVPWESRCDTLEVDGHDVPCALRVVVHRGSAMELEWAVDFHVHLCLSTLPLESKGVMRALVVQLFSSAPPWRSCAPRCVSYMGYNGRASVLPCGERIPYCAQQQQRRCNATRRLWQWEHLLSSGELHAVAVVGLVDYVIN